MKQEQQASERKQLDWSGGLAVGVPSIDEQHALLFRVANRLLAHPEARAHDEAVVDILTDLGKFIVLHFQTEETCMRQLGMPAHEIEAHVQAHNRILDQYADLNMSAVRGRHHSAGEIYDQVRVWLSDHLQADDLKIKNFVATRNKA